AIVVETACTGDREAVQHGRGQDVPGGRGAIHQHAAFAVASLAVDAVDYDAIGIGHVVVVDVTGKDGPVCTRIALPQFDLVAREAAVYALPGPDAETGAGITRGGGLVDAAGHADLAATGVAQRGLQAGEGVRPARAIVRPGRVAFHMAGRHFHLHRADVAAGALRAWHAALVDHRTEGIVGRIERRASSARQHRPGAAAVVGQGAKQWVGIDHVRAGRRRRATAGDDAGVDHRLRALVEDFRASLAG